MTPNFSEVMEVYVGAFVLISCPAKLISSDEGGDEVEQVLRAVGPDGPAERLFDVTASLHKWKRLHPQQQQPNVAMQ